MKAFIVLALGFISMVSGGYPRLTDFFWREYEGYIPEDAVKVSQNGSDVPVYIGQGYFDDGGLLPGMIQEGKMELAAVVNGKVITINHNIKIMATFSPRPQTDFQWISTNYANLEALQSFPFLNLVPGGSEASKVVYIGRHSESEYINIGKISTVAPNQGLIIPDAKGEPTLYKDFDIFAMLTFDCDENKLFLADNSQESSENSHRALKKKSLSSRSRSPRQRSASSEEY